MSLEVCVMGHGKMSVDKSKLLVLQEEESECDHWLDDKKTHLKVQASREHSL